MMATMKNIHALLLTILMAATASVTHAQVAQRQSRLDVRILTHDASILLTTDCIQSKLVGYNKQLVLIVDPSWLTGDSTSLTKFRAITDGRFDLTIELPNIDDTASPFVSMKNLGPMQLCAIFQIGSVEMAREVTISNVRVLTDNLVTFDIDLFIDTRGMLTPAIRRWQMHEIEVCGTNVALLHYQEHQ